MRDEDNLRFIQILLLGASIVVVSVIAGQCAVSAAYHDMCRQLIQEGFKDTKENKGDK